VLHEIFQNSITGAKLTFISKFSNTRTTQVLFGSSQSADQMLREIYASDIATILHWIQLFDTLKSLDANAVEEVMCPTKLAQTLRDDTWSHLLKGRPIEGVTVLHPVHQFAPLSSQNYQDLVIDETKEHITFFSTKPLSPMDLTKRGPYPAFVGSATREKRSGRMYQLPKASRPLQSAERLVQLADRTISTHTKLYEYISSLAECRTNMPLQVLRMTTSKIVGGSVTDRMDDHVTKRGTLNSFRPNITTHFYYSTDMMGKFSRGRENYNLHFQDAEHYGFSWLQISICHAQQFKRQRVLHLVYKGESCEEKLLDTLIHKDHEFPLIKVHTDNPLLYSYIETLPVAFSPTTKSFFKHITKRPAAEAIAFILFTRCITSSATYTIGLTEQANPTMSHVGVSEIVGAGLENIIHHLSKYLHLYLPKDRSLAREILHNLSSRCFVDVVAVCLIPEVLPHLEKIAGFGPNS
jgi:hypothetical protein